MKWSGYYYSNKRSNRFRTEAKRFRKKRTYKSLGRTETQNEIGISLRGKATLIVLFLVILALGYVLFASDFFKVKRAVLVGNEKIKEDDIKNIIKEAMDNKRFYFFKGDNLFLVNDGKIKDRIKNEILLVESLEIKRHFPDTLKVNLVERQPFAIWISNNKKYLIDAKGMACYEINDDISGLPIIYDKQNKEVKVNSTVTYPKQINFIKSAVDLLKEKTNLETESISMPNSLGFQVNIKIKNSFEIYFNTERSVESQIIDLKNVLEKQIKDSRVGISYIDLRVENWVYYK